MIELRPGELWTPDMLVLNSINQFDVLANVKYFYVYSNGTVSVKPLYIMYNKKP